MVTVQQAEPRTIKGTAQDLHNPALLARATELETDIHDIEKALRIASVLQTTLDLRKIVEIFVHEAGRWIPFSGVRYVHPGQDTGIVMGSEEKHSVAYRLVLADQPLGEIRFTRRRKFSAKENTILEYLLCGLVYPLRNALAYQSAVQAALKDPLTGINNRSAMDATMAREVDLARRHGTPLSLVAADIDFFKHINDSHGHATGDCVLRAAADAIVETVRSSDVAFRYGGEEFMVLLSNTSREGALLLAERIRRKVEAMEILCNGALIRVTISLGVACLGGGDTGQSLFQKADEALYAAKGAGRNCVRCNAD